MIFSRRRIVVTLLSAASCRFQLADGMNTYVPPKQKNTDIKRQRGLSDIRTITTVDGCERSTKYGIWLYAGGGHISLIGSPIMDNNKGALPNSNGDNEDSKNGIGTSGADYVTTSCPTLAFGDGGENLDKAMYDLSIVFEQDDNDSSNGNQDLASASSNENHVATWWKEDAMRLHKTNYKNANKTSSSFALAEVTRAYNHAMHRIGDYDIFNNNCATFVLNMMAELGIKVDDRMIKFAASELYANHTAIEPVLQNQTFMKELFLEFDHGVTTTSSHKTNKTGLLRSSNYHQAQVASGGNIVADSLEGAELFVTHYVNEWSTRYRRMRKKPMTPPPPMPSRQGGARRIPP